MNDWLKQNGLALVVYAIGLAVAFTTLSARVLAVENDHLTIEVRLDKIEELTERLIVIEERTGNNREDILEIKDDIKDLKEHFNVQ